MTALHPSSLVSLGQEGGVTIIETIFPPNLFQIFPQNYFMLCSLGFIPIKTSLHFPFSSINNTSGVREHQRKAQSFTCYLYDSGCLTPIGSKMTQLNQGNSLKSLAQLSYKI